MSLPDVVLAGRLEDVIDASKLAPGAVRRRCRACRAIVLVSPATLTLAVAKGLDFICTRCLPAGMRQVAPPTAEQLREVANVLARGLS